jgi:phospholipid/cholesterol/gamma-HCH transport system ATP-binding protein
MTHDTTAQNAPQTAVRSDRPFVELAGVHKSFGATKVLDGVNLSASHGNVLTILGGSGSGKSVMLKHMIGLLRPDEGRVLIEGQDVTTYGEREWFDVRKRIGYVFQGAALFDSLSVYENIAYPLREHLDRNESEIEERVATCLASIGLEDVGAKMPSELSGGMRKRVGVARAIALQPQAIFYDEPTTGLDPANSRRIGELIKQLQQNLGVTSVVVTHDIELCLAVSERVVLLDRGKIRLDKSLEEFRTSTSPELQALLGAEHPVALSMGLAGEGGIHER